LENDDFKKMMVSKHTYRPIVNVLNFVKKQINWLSQVGGDNGKEFVWGCLERLMTFWSVQ
jgi:hypothetical protein